MGDLAVAGVAARLVVVLGVIVVCQSAQRRMGADAGRESGQLRPVDGRQFRRRVELHDRIRGRPRVERRRRTQAERRAGSDGASVIDKRCPEGADAVGLQQRGVGDHGGRSRSGRVVNAGMSVVPGGHGPSGCPDGQGCRTTQPADVGGGERDRPGPARHGLHGGGGGRFGGRGVSRVRIGGGNVGGDRSAASSGGLEQRRQARDQPGPAQPAEFVRVGGIQQRYLVGVGRRGLLRSRDDEVVQFFGHCLPMRSARSLRRARAAASCRRPKTAIR